MGKDRQGSIGAEIRETHVTCLLQTHLCEMNRLVWCLSLPFTIYVASHPKHHLTSRHSQRDAVSTATKTLIEQILLRRRRRFSIRSGVLGRASSDGCQEKREERTSNSRNTGSYGTPGRTFFVQSSNSQYFSYSPGIVEQSNVESTAVSSVEHLRIVAPLLVTDLFIQFVIYLVLITLY